MDSLPLEKSLGHLGPWQSFVELNYCWTTLWYQSHGDPTWPRMQVLMNSLICDIYIFLRINFLTWRRRESETYRWTHHLRKPKYTWMQTLAGKSHFPWWSFPLLLLCIPCRMCHIIASICHFPLTDVVTYLYVIPTHLHKHELKSI